MAAIQIAKTRNAVIFGSASPSKHAFLKAQGCDHVLDSGREFTPQVRAIVGERGIDLILDPVGGKSWTQAYELLAPCGRLVAFGLSAAAGGNTRNLIHALKQLISVKRWSPMQLMNDNKTISGTNMGHLFDRADLIEPQLAACSKCTSAVNSIRTSIATFPFAEAARAHQYIHDRKARGKVLLVP